MKNVLAETQLQPIRGQRDNVVGANQIIMTSKHISFFLK